MSVTIYLIIYDLTSLNKFLHIAGLGAYHSSVQIFDTEFSYGAHPYKYSGVIESQPNTNKNLFLRKKINMGESHLKLNEINKIITEIKKKYIGSSYDIFFNNCNHFTNELCIQLLNKKIPNYINRLCNLGKYLRCVLSKKLIRGDAVDSDAQEYENAKNKKIRSKLGNLLRDKKNNSLIQSVNLNELDLSKNESQTQKSEIQENGNVFNIEVKP